MGNYIGKKNVKFIKVVLNLWFLNIYKEILGIKEDVVFWNNERVYVGELNVGFFSVCMRLFGMGE